MIQSRLPGIKESVLDSTLRVTKDRLNALGSTLISDTRCDHDNRSLSDALRRAVADAPELILVSGASAVVDRRDVIPSAIETIGGEILHFGMPVDPGNLMLIGKIGKIPVIGMPGCARSPKLNGFDWVLERLCANLDINPHEIMSMGTGGLLKDVPHRRCRAQRQAYRSGSHHVGTVQPQAIRNRGDPACRRTIVPHGCIKQAAQHSGRQAACAPRSRSRSCLFCGTAYRCNRP